MNAASPIRALVLEDARKTRNALVALLDGTPGFTCVGACETAAIALRHIPLAKPDVVLADLELPGMTGTEFLAVSRRRFPELAQLVLTVHDSPEWVFPALAAGACGYVVKGTPPAKLIEAIIEAREGRSWMSGQVARLVLESFRRQPSRAPASPPLSPREIEVLESLTQGRRYAEIAAHLGISQRTVNTHLYNIYEKLHVHSAAGAVGKWLGRRDHAPP